MPQPHVTAAILDAVRSRPGYPDLSVLDLSCGDGEILQALADDGATVRGTHFAEDDYITESPRPILETGVIDTGVDLLARLPYDDGQFDVVLMTEVLEHLPNHLPVVAEAGLVAKPGGWYIASTPNMHRLHSRLHFFLTGTGKLIRRRTGWDLSPDDLYAFHINPVDLPLMHTLLHQAGLMLEDLPKTMVKKRHLWLLAFWPLCWAATMLETSPKSREPDAYKAGERDLRRWLLHSSTLLSEQLVFVARRRP